MIDAFPTGGRRSRGQVLVVTLLAILLLVGLIFYVMNTGGHLSRRVAAQNAADAAAMSAGVHMARSMNTLAMNNVSISRMLAAVVTLDGLERHLEASLRQAEAFETRLIDQVTDAGPAGPLHAATAETLATIRDRLEYEKGLLEERLPLVRDLDVQSYTTYTIPGRSNPAPHGGFWAAARDLALFSEATCQFAPAGAQANAAQYADFSGADEGLVVPAAPVLPARRGTWDDWYQNADSRGSLLVHGWIPDLDFTPQSVYTDAQSEVLALSSGPFWKLFRWRDGVSSLLEPASGFAFLGGGGFGSHPGEGPARSGAVSYRTFGPVTWMHRLVYDDWYDNMHYCVPHYADGGRVRTLLSGLQAVKLGYMFSPGPDRRLHDPEWETSYTAALITSRPCELTAHFRLEIVGPYGADDARIASIATDPQYSNSHDPLLLLQADRRDRSSEQARAALMVVVTIRPTVFGDDTPEEPEIPGEFTVVTILRPSRSWVKIADHIWQTSFTPDDFEAELRSQAVGGRLWGLIAARLDLPDDYPPFEFDYAVDIDLPYVTYRDIFAGADFGADTTVHNPANYASGDYPEALPVPYLLDWGRWAGDTDMDDHDEGFRREALTLLGIARSAADADVWPDRFTTAAPGGAMMALAQVELYNPTSFDLWTQDWRVQLTPVTQMDAWARSFSDTRDLYDDVRLPDGGGGRLEGADLDMVEQYLEALDDADAEQAILH